MPREISGELTSRGLKVAIVASRFNSFIVEQLVAGAVDALQRTGCRDQDIAVFRAPGAFEIPQLLRRVVQRGGFDAVVCVGAVIRGATPHFEHISSAVTSGVAQVAVSSEVPITFGVLTCDSIEQAIERAGTKAGNKGFESAMAVVEMVHLLRNVDRSGGSAGAGSVSGG
jgi:6,7-dimethyl-8-ribityllumazine synthase